MFAGWSLSVLFSINARKLTLVIMLVLTVATALSARVVRPRDYEMIDKVRARIADADFDTTRAYADTITVHFYTLIDFYNQHVIDCHNQVGLSFYPSSINLDTFLSLSQSDSTIQPDSARWVRLGRELDSLHSSMCAFQGVYNQHLSRWHPGIDTLSTSVCEILLPDEEMGNRQSYEHKMMQLEQMLTNLYRCYMFHVLNHHFPCVIED